MSQQYLYVKAICAGRLISADLGTSSDPFVSMTIEGTTKKTSVVNNCSTPVWNESFVFPVTDLAQPAIFKVLDSDTFGTDNLGSFQFDLRRIPADTDHVRMFKLYGGEHGGNVFSSFLSQAEKTKAEATSNIAATAVGTATGNAEAGKWMSSLMQKASAFGQASAEGDDEEEKANIALAASHDTGSLLGAIDSNFGVATFAFRLFDSEEEAAAYDLPIPEPKGQLTVRIVGGRNLLSTDLGTRPCSDPYLTFNVGEQRAESTAISNSVHPDWNSETVGFDNVQNGEQLVITGWDNDRGPGDDDQLGEAVIDPSHLEVGRESFCVVRLIGGGTGENVSAILNDHAAPLAQNMAAFGAEQAVGGPMGKIAGSVIQKIPGAEDDDDNKGSICIGLTLSAPLGDGEPATTLPGTPSKSPRPYKDTSNSGPADAGNPAKDTLNSAHAAITSGFSSFKKFF